MLVNFLFKQSLNIFDDTIINHGRQANKPFPFSNGLLSIIIILGGHKGGLNKPKKKGEKYMIETVENKPLAQVLYKSVDIGQQVPPELYQAVAEILAFVYQLKGKVPARA
jgi:hypothetical protein